MFGDEYSRVMKHHKVVKLRMSPELKKDGRKKMRLLLKGYMEPQEWTGKSDSPTAMTSSIKMLVAMGIDPDDPAVVEPDDDVTSTGDVSTARLHSSYRTSMEQMKYQGMWVTNPTRRQSCKSFSLRAHCMGNKALDTGGGSQSHSG